MEISLNKPAEFPEPTATQFLSFGSNQSIFKTRYLKYFHISVLSVHHFISGISFSLRFLSQSRSNIFQLTARPIRVRTWEGSQVGRYTVWKVSFLLHVRVKRLSKQSNQLHVLYLQLEAKQISNAHLCHFWDESQS